MTKITVKEFLALGFTEWKECHWTLASNEEAARIWFKRKGYEGTFYEVPFGYWLPIR